MRIPFYCFLSFLLHTSSVFSQEKELQDEPEKRGEAWLGIDLSKPSDDTIMQLPSLPSGIGFVISGVSEGGPAAKAGIRKSDLLWKMDEQLLINEGQLATLLRISSPDKTVLLSIYREGKNIDFKVVLGELNAAAEKAAQQQLLESVIRMDDGAMRIVNLGEKRAVVANDKGTVEVVRTADGDCVMIQNQSGKIIFDGVLRGRTQPAGLSKEWQKEVCAMRRSLDHASQVAPAAARLPRPRIIAPQPAE